MQRLISEFPFVETRQPDGTAAALAEAVALSGLITVVARGALTVAPLHVYNAPTAGSGKSYLVDIAATIATGRPCPVINAGHDEAEMEKRLVGLLLAGFPIVSLDNINGELGGDLLCQAVERPLLRIRALGSSAIFEIESAVTMFGTGNNLRVRGDMVRRTVVAELDPEMERPEMRTFRSDPVQTIQADRGRYVSACLTVVLAYLAAGSPGRLRPIASYSEWSDLIRSALVWLGCADPALSMERAREEDPELADLRAVMTAWTEAIGPGEVTVRYVIDMAASKAPRVDAGGDPEPYGAATEPRFPALEDALERVAGLRGTIDARKLGDWLRRNKGRVVGGFRFSPDGTSGGSARWALRQAQR